MAVRSRGMAVRGRGMAARSRGVAVRSQSSCRAAGRGARCNAVWKRKVVKTIADVERNNLAIRTNYLTSVSVQIDPKTVTKQRVVTHKRTVCERP